jgi:hypothetical protein
MTNMTKKLIIAFCLFGFGTALQAQEAILATGSNASGSGGSVSYSVGQVVYTTNTGTNSSVAQGVQQPFEISVVTSIEQAKSISLQCSAYPNPTIDFLTLKVENFQLSTLNFQLFDIRGKLLVSKKVENSETTIAMSNFVSATYFLKVTQANKEIKTFKIIKK